MVKTTIDCKKCGASFCFTYSSVGLSKSFMLSDLKVVKAHLRKCQGEVDPVSGRCVWPKLKMRLAKIELTKEE